LIYKILSSYLVVSKYPSKVAVAHIRTNTNETTESRILKKLEFPIPTPFYIQRGILSVEVSISKAQI